MTFCCTGLADVDGDAAVAGAHALVGAVEVGAHEVRATDAQGPRVELRRPAGPVEEHARAGRPHVIAGGRRRGRRGDEERGRRDGGGELRAVLVHGLEEAAVGPLLLSIYIYI